MKIIFAATVLAAASLPGIAAAEFTPKDPMAFCKQSESLAGTIMSGRQSGVPMSKMMEVAADSQLVRSMVTMAFEKTRWHTEERQAREIQDFSEMAFSSCWKALNK